MAMCSFTVEEEEFQEQDSPTSVLTDLEEAQSSTNGHDSEEKALWLKHSTNHMEKGSRRMKKTHPKCLPASKIKSILKTEICTSTRTEKKTKFLESLIANTSRKRVHFPKNGTISHVKVYHESEEEKSQKKEAINEVLQKREENEADKIKEMEEAAREVVTWPLGEPSQGCPPNSVKIIEETRNNIIQSDDRKKRKMESLQPDGTNDSTSSSSMKRRRNELTLLALNGSIESLLTYLINSDEWSVTTKKNNSSRESKTSEDNSFSKTMQMLKNTIKCLQEKLENTKQGKYAPLEAENEHLANLELKYKLLKIFKECGRAISCGRYILPKSLKQINKSYNDDAIIKQRRTCIETVCLVCEWIGRFNTDMMTKHKKQTKGKKNNTTHASTPMQTDIQPAIQLDANAIVSKFDNFHLLHSAVSACSRDSIAILLDLGVNPNYVWSDTYGSATDLAKDLHQQASQNPDLKEEQAIYANIIKDLSSYV